MWLQAVIVEGILNGEIELLLKYLAQRFDPEVADWMNVISTGLNETVIFLLEKEMGYAKKMIKNMVIAYMTISWSLSVITFRSCRTAFGGL